MFDIVLRLLLCIMPLQLFDILSSINKQILELSRIWGILTVFIWPISLWRETLEPPHIDLKREIPRWHTLSYFGCWTWRCTLTVIVVLVNFRTWKINININFRIYKTSNRGNQIYSSSEKYFMYILRIYFEMSLAL